MNSKAIRDTKIALITDDETRELQEAQARLDDHLSEIPLDSVEGIELRKLLIEKLELDHGKIRKKYAQKRDEKIEIEKASLITEENLRLLEEEVNSSNKTKNLLLFLGSGFAIFLAILSYNAENSGPSACECVKIEPMAGLNKHYGLYISPEDAKVWKKCVREYGDDLQGSLAMNHACHGSNDN